VPQAPSAGVTPEVPVATAGSAYPASADNLVWPSAALSPNVPASMGQRAVPNDSTVKQGNIEAESMRRQLITNQDELLHMRLDFMELVADNMHGMHKQVRLPPSTRMFDERFVSQSLNSCYLDRCRLGKLEAELDHKPEVEDWIMWLAGRPSYKREWRTTPMNHNFDKTPQGLVGSSDDVDDEGNFKVGPALHGRPRGFPSGLQQHIKRYGVWS